MVNSRFLKKSGPRVSVSIDLVLLILLSVHFFYLKPTEAIFGGEATFTYYLLMLAYLYIRYLGFSIRFGIRKKLIPLAWFVTGILLSFIPAYKFYGQHLYYSLIAYRHFLLLLTLPVLLSIQPSWTEIKRAVYAFSVLYVFLCVYVTYVAPGWVVLGDGHLLLDEGEFVHLLPGLQFVSMAFIFSLDEFRNKLSVKRFMPCAFFFLIIVLLQNRTHLFCSLAVIVMASLFNKSAKTRVYTEVLLLIVTVSMVILLNQYFIGLWDETVMQLNDPDYNRVKAFMYFTSLENGPLAFLLGNGFISGRVNPIMQNLMKEGIFNSDLGLIGMWHQFGILTVLVLLVYMIKGLSHKRSFIVQAFALTMLLGMLTISYFVEYEYLLWLCFYFYLLGTDEIYSQSMAIEESRIVRRALRRYRSISSS